MRSQIYSFALLLASTLASAQNILPTGCGQSCSVLQQAESACSAQTGQTGGIALGNCFCQSTNTQILYTSPDVICVAECPQSSDRVALQSWFRQYCLSIGQGVDPNAASTSSPSTTMVTVTSTSTPGATAGADSSTAGATRPSASTNESWWSGHYQYVIMVIVLAVGLAALAWLLIWLKKRHRRRVDERRARLSGFPTESEKQAGAASATPELWGPAQHMQANQDWNYHEGAAGVVPRDRPRRERRRSRHHSAKPGSRTRPAEDVIEQAPPAISRQPSAKGKRVEETRTTEVAPERGQSQSRSRSRNRGRKGKKYDFDRDIEGR